MPGAGHFRAHERRSIHLAASLRPADDDQEYEASILDLGLAGARLELGRPLTVGAHVVVRLVAPTLWDPLVLDAIVAWTDASSGRVRAGVRFLHTNEHGAGALFELLGAEDYDEEQ